MKLSASSSLMPLLLVGLSAVLPQDAQAADASSKPARPATASDRFASRRTWVEEVRAEDFFFWDRFIRRFDSGGKEFPQPPEWYVPSALVEGAESNAFPRTSARTISDSAWQDIRAWATSRKTGALMVARRGQIEYEFYDSARQAGELAAVRSFTKTLAALLVGIAIGRGEIHSLDDPIKRYLPEWSQDARGDIRLRDLLTWSSGLAATQIDSSDPDNRALRMAEGSNIRALALAWPMDHRPNTHWTVNQVDQQIIAIILERATGRRFERYLSEMLWQPLGAGTATMNLDGKEGDVRAFCCMRARLVDWL